MSLGVMLITGTPLTWIQHKDIYRKVTENSEITVPSFNLNDRAVISLEDPDVEVQVSYKVSSYTNFNGHVRPLESCHNHYQSHQHPMLNLSHYPLNHILL